jgi:hypothetical protein
LRPFSDVQGNILSPRQSWTFARRQERRPDDHTEERRCSVVEALARAEAAGTGGIGRSPMATYFLSFADDERLLGCAIFDMKAKRAPMRALVRRAWRLGINPGGSAYGGRLADDAIPEAYKNQLITDQVILKQLGFRPRRICPRCEELLCVRLRFAAGDRLKPK